MNYNNSSEIITFSPWLVVFYYSLIEEMNKLLKVLKQYEIVEN